MCQLPLLNTLPPLDTLSHPQYYAHISHAVYTQEPTMFQRRHAECSAVPYTTTQRPDAGLLANQAVP